MNTPCPPKGLLVAAPSSGSGKTVLTLAMLRALRNAGHSISAAKTGPDYIDPAFHALASGKEAFNLDPWAMPEHEILTLVSDTRDDLLLVEGMMGLFDGASDGKGSAADLAATLGIPVLLVVDAAKQSHSIAALVRGFRDHRADITIGGVLLNKVGSERHEHLLRNALEGIGIPVLGAIRRCDALHLPERHLGLVQAGETCEIDAFINDAAVRIESQVDMAALVRLFAEAVTQAGNGNGRFSGLPAEMGQHVAIAKDRAFSFIYPHLLRHWRSAGREVSFFSPLNDEAPDERADSVFLPGGYPELYGGNISSATKFKAAMSEAVRNGKTVYGECGGYMVMGRGIIDQNGVRHAMLDMLDLETSFEKRKLHLGYRRMRGLGGPFAGRQFAGHEFHYTTALREEGQALFEVEDALGVALGSTGLQNGGVMGSYLHLISGHSASEISE